MAVWLAGTANVEANSELGITQIYKKNREQLWDSGKRKAAYKEKVFNGSKTYADPITGNTLHFSKKAAQNKYHMKDAEGNNNSTAYASHVPETDHIVSLKEMHTRVKGNPFLTDKDLQDIANKDYNYRLLSKSANASKSDTSDYELIQEAIKKRISSEESKKKIVNQLTDFGIVELGKERVIADICLTGDLTARTIKNAGKEFATGAQVAVESAAIPLMVAGVQNLCMVASGEKEMDEAVKDMGMMTGQVITIGGGKQLVTDVLSFSAKNGTQIISSLSANALKLIGPVSQILTVSTLVGDSVLRCVNGEISAADFFEEISVRGAGILVNILGNEMLMSILPGAVALGPAGIAAYVGSMVISMACTTCCMKVIEFKKQVQQDREISSRKLAQVSKLANEAMAEIRHQQKELSELIGREYAHWDGLFQLGFEKIYEGSLYEDVEQLSEGLSSILSVFGKSVRFKDMDEFDEFFFSEEAFNF